MQGPVFYKFYKIYLSLVFIDYWTYNMLQHSRVKQGTRTRQTSDDLVHTTSLTSSPDSYIPPLLEKAANEICRDYL
jgi:hypothetical protein